MGNSLRLRYFMFCPFLFQKHVINKARLKLEVLLLSIPFTHPYPLLRFPLHRPSNRCRSDMATSFLFWSIQFALQTGSLGQAFVPKFAFVCRPILAKTLVVDPPIIHCLHLSMVRHPKALRIFFRIFRLIFSISDPEAEWAAASAQCNPFVALPKARNSCPQSPFYFINSFIRAYSHEQMGSPTWLIVQFVACTVRSVPP